MPILVVCSHCGQRGEVSRSAGGCDVKCAMCGKTFAVPLGSGHVAVEWGVGMTGTRVPLTPGKELRIGRAPDNELVLGTERVSRHHAALNWAEGEWSIQDLGSSNGLAVDGHRVRFATVTSGSKFTIGDIVLRVTLVNSPKTSDSNLLDEMAMHESHDSVPGTLQPVDTRVPSKIADGSSSADTFAGESPVNSPPMKRKEIPEHQTPNHPAPTRMGTAKKPSWVVFGIVGVGVVVVLLIAWRVFS